MKKPGRNDPCYCGSGRKYKQCCSSQDQQQQAVAQRAQASVPALLRTAIAHHEADRLDEAGALYRQILELDACQSDALQYLGVIAHSHGDYAGAIELIASSLRAKPADPFAHCNMGNALLALGQHVDALASYERALEISPDFIQALYNKGNALLDLSRPEAALGCFERVLLLKPDFAEAWCNQGNALLALQRAEAALASFTRALELKPNFKEAICNQGIALQALKRFDAALTCYSRALQLNPDYASAYNNLGSALQEMNRLDDARTCYGKALQLRADYAEAHYNLGTAWQALRNPDAALACFGKALQIRPDYVQAMSSLGATLQQLKRFDDAAVCYHATLDLAPADPYALGMLANCALQVCDWQAMAAYAPLLRAGIARGEAVIMPFTLLGFGVPAAEQLACAKTYLHDRVRALAAPLWNGERYAHGRIRVAYLSADFYQHPTACLMAELIELHDRSRFEVIGISFGPDDQSPIRARLVAAFDQFHEVRAMSDAQAAALLRALEVDIAVDLKGYTQDARFGILAQRPAPIQVNYLGYPGSMGADFIDYIIADRHVLPFGQAADFAEKIVQLPDSYQVNDSTRALLAPSSRADCGLPETGFVFCCFNNNYKITPQLFDIWMRLLHAVDGSVLWLLHDNDAARANLERAARTCDIDPARLVFAPRIAVEQHLARHQLADLFVDTLPINAHTTASDALWAGLPLVTCPGDSFAGRVAQSLLYALDLPQLVAPDLVAYEALALALATDAPRLLALRAQLAQRRHSGALFDTDRFRRHLESAYDTMWQKEQRGEAPAGFAVAPESP
jgi:protein O-GlcNAc transferase